MNKKILIIIIAVVAAAAIGIGLYFFVFADKEAPIVLSNYPIAEPFTTNVAESGRLFRAGIVLVLNTDNASVVEQLDGKAAQARDTIIRILREMKEEDIRSATAQADLGAKIKDVLNKTLTFENDKFSNVVEDVYFTDFFMQ